MDARVKLVISHGVDPNAEVGGALQMARCSAYAAAITSGHPRTAELLLRLGASPALSPDQAVVAAVFTGDPVDAESVPAAVASRPGLVAWAASLGNRDAVRRAVEHGLDVNQQARTDVPSDQEWETGLHRRPATATARWSSCCSSWEPTRR